MTGWRNRRARRAAQAHRQTLAEIAAEYEMAKFAEEEARRAELNTPIGVTRKTGGHAHTAHGRDQW